MAGQPKSARNRLVNAAFQLFSSQGVGATTTRQVADLAGVNEVTLFRQFGSKHGLLAAVMTEAVVLSGPDPRFDRAAIAQAPVAEALKEFVAQLLDALGERSELVRSVIGEAGQFSADNSQAMGQGLQAIRDFIAEYLEALGPVGDRLLWPPEEVAGLAIALLVGYTAIEGTTEHHGLWPSRAAFVERLASGLQSLYPAAAGVSLAPPATTPEPDRWLDLPAPLVDQIMQAARRSGGQAYALVYVLLGAGVTVAEVPLLTRRNALYDSNQHILLVGPQRRQVPLNQWIMGKRYGTYTKNPLTRWLKSRGDDCPAMFMGPDNQPITPLRVRQLWAEITADIVAPTGAPPAVEQTRITWCVEMLLKGLDRQQLSLLSGLSPEQIDPLAQMAQARSALAQALRLDRQPGEMTSGLDPAAETTTPGHGR